MWAIVRLAIDICLFRKGPQHLPYSSLLFYLAMLAYSFASLLLLSLSTGLWDAMLQLLVEIAILCGFSWGMLKLANHAARFYQTTAALLLTDTLITVCALPVFGALARGETSALFALLVLALMAWHWLVIGHIFRHAVGTSFTFGLCLALMFIIASFQLAALLFSVF